MILTATASTGVSAWTCSLGGRPEAGLVILPVPSLVRICRGRAAGTEQHQDRYHEVGHAEAQRQPGPQVQYQATGSQQQRRSRRRHQQAPSPSRRITPRTSCISEDMPRRRPLDLRRPIRLTDAHQYH